MSSRASLTYTLCLWVSVVSLLSRNRSVTVEEHHERLRRRHSCARNDSIGGSSPVRARARRAISSAARSSSAAATARRADVSRQRRQTPEAEGVAQRRARRGRLELRRRQRDGRSGDRRPDLESISRGEYGAVDGLPRILRMLDKHQLPASFFIPAVSHLLHPRDDSGHPEERTPRNRRARLDSRAPALRERRALEQDMLTRAIDTLTKAMGKRPVGYRAPSWQFSQLDDEAGEGRGISLRQQPDGERRCRTKSCSTSSPPASWNCRSSGFSTTFPTSAAPPTAECRTRI